ncbi:hypothetical protein FHR36_007206 [Kitasatospora paracochleata]|uniref:Uncharacterized protein n=1 Tax=Kitasatospora paracochleata TaxID=58354 RepID=A0ABT1J979_9ACTN|nr:hypothetical protein [Kitasatospora paracochleata]
MRRIGQAVRRWAPTAAATAGAAAALTQVMDWLMR